MFPLKFSCTPLAFFKTRRSKYPSFPRRRESGIPPPFLDSRLRGNDGHREVARTGCIGFPFPLPEMLFTVCHGRLSSLSFPLFMNSS
jgi:hypothetical protein